MALIACTICGNAKESPVREKTGQPRIPRAWKQIAGKHYCPKCKAQDYALRAISIPVAACDWETIGKLHRDATHNITSAANALMQTYTLWDRLAETDGGFRKQWTTPAYERLYPAIRKALPQIEPTSLVSLINTVQSNYRARRFDLWRHAISLPSYRDLPVPINSQAFRIVQEDGRWKFEFRWCGTWHSLTLRGGGEFHRQTKVLAQIVAGEVEGGEAAIYRKDKALMVKIAAWMQRGKAVEAKNTVKAHTDANAFLIATCNGATWTLNGDHVRRWIIGADVQQQRLRQDLKAERRFPIKMRKGITNRQGFLSRHFRDRLDSWTHEVSMSLVNWAKRQKAARLEWDDTERGFVRHFPWFQLAQRLESKCQMAGIEFVDASAEVVEKTPQALAKEEA